MLLAFQKGRNSIWNINSINIWRCRRRCKPFSAKNTRL